MQYLYNIVVEGICSVSPHLRAGILFTPALLWPKSAQENRIMPKGSDK